MKFIYNGNSLLIKYDETDCQEEIDLVNNAVEQAKIHIRIFNKLYYQHDDKHKSN